jgi:RNA polymerase sigma-70 factor (ECF subfamily)
MQERTKRNPATRAHPDKQLVERMLAGDRDGFDEFFEELAPRLSRFAHSRLRADPEVVREIVQTSLCTAIDSLESYRGEAALFSWICGICRFEILAHLRRSRTGPTAVELVEDSPELQGRLESLTSAIDDPEERAERHEVAKHVHLALDYLPARYSRALEWKYCDGLSVKEIAERLQVGPKAAESILTRARVAFREVFDGVGEGATLLTHRTAE